ncbi:MAG: hypothetical protein GEV28_26930 [Actinophytocola sp.]|uniref:CoxG family protein n=1 Tax=Actinophytocola sp. TaxID=1872138 RepID=UPI001320E73E|nr:SRPBCC domain-containing protein [Actinophytocola sp.]MPZ83830.1 hypothetical protein [Actinophytocola sp.]
MKLVSEFPVPAAPDKVFPLFFDPETMRGCIPGCEELERVDEKNYRGRLVNEVAHVRFSAGFTAAIASVADGADDKEVRAVLKGEDRKLGSLIKIDARLTVRPDSNDDGTDKMDASVIGYEMDMALWGKLGRLGEPIIRRRSREVELEFAKSLAIACGAPVEQVEAAAATKTAAGGVVSTTTSPAVPKVAIIAAVVAGLTVLGTVLVAVLRRGR